MNLRLSDRQPVSGLHSSRYGLNSAHNWHTTRCRRRGEVDNFRMARDLLAENSALKSDDAVMEAQRDLVDVVQTLRQSCASKAKAGES